MLHYLGLTSEYPMLKIVGDVIYYSLISSAILLTLSLIYKRLISLGYNKKKVALFTLLCVAVIFPAMYTGARAAGMFNKPMNEWSLDVLVEFMRSGTSHTFHGGLILSAICISILIVLMRFKYLEAMDAFFLYVPLAHAVGRIGCFIVGCCWGRYVALDFMGINTRFPNPVPVYAIGVNVLIFLFLKRLYENIYSSQEARKAYAGSVIASYFVLYGAARIIMEIFRKERSIGFGLTQAQAAMFILIVTGLIVMMVVRHRLRRSGVEAQLEASTELRKLFLLGGFLASYLLLFFVIYYLLKKAHVLPWPFRKVETIMAGYAGILYYIPFTAAPALALYWLEKSGITIGEKFKWNRFSNLFYRSAISESETEQDIMRKNILSLHIGSERVFYAGLAFSIFYTMYLLVMKEPRLRGLVFWPPVVILSAMNAVSEEIVYRFAAYNIFIQAGYSKPASNIAQSILYSLIHFIMGGPLLGAFSLVYGIILGMVMERSDSVTPCIICHFLIDIGCIGLPMLSY
jgi:prolipoprotein diacylglyceryltransferase